LYASLRVLPYHARTVRARLPGFPQRFPVRSDGRRPWRYRIVSFLCRVVLRTWFGRDLVIDGRENVPRDGPLLVVSNHLSNIDPTLFGGYAPGAFFCITKQELFKNRFFAWVLAGCNCFPVDRGSADRWALRTSLDILAARGRLLIFVEGTRATAPGMKQAEAGVGFLARRSGARVLPVAVWGTEQALPRGRRLPRRVPIRMVFGTPVDVALPEGRGDDGAIADQIARRVAALLPPEYRGVYR
jgi:1-acyl-sn-glycerol-3-phosphate acyltransferase